MKKKTEELLAKLNAENGPVYAKQEDLETVEVGDDDAAVSKNQFGFNLSIKLKDGSSRFVTIRGIDAKTDIKDVPSKFMLELHEAMRELPAQGNRRAIPKGTQKVFAVAA